jgi:hypothetical protein
MAAMAAGIALSATPAAADMVFYNFNSPIVGAENILLPSGVVGTSLTGTGDDTGGQVLFTASEDLMVGSQPNRLAVSDGGTGSLTIQSVGGNYFTGFLFDLNATIDTTSVVSVVEPNGETTNFNFTVSGVGENVLTIKAVNGQTISSITLNMPVGGEIAGLNLLRASFLGVTPPPGVPEPATWALTILGFAGAGAALRSRRRMASASG